MRYVAIFAAGVLLGKNWDKVMRTMAPVVRAAADQFELMYAETAQTVGQRIETIEDRIAERGHINSGSPAHQLGD